MFCVFVCTGVQGGSHTYRETGLMIFMRFKPVRFMILGGVSTIYDNSREAAHACGRAEVVYYKTKELTFSNHIITEIARCVEFSAACSKYKARLAAARAMTGPLRRIYRAARRLSVAVLQWMLGLIVEIRPRGELETIPGGRPSEMVSIYNLASCTQRASETQYYDVLFRRAAGVSKAMRS